MSQTAAPSTSFSQRARLANLDLLRCLAIMLVLVFHGVLMWPGRSFEIPRLIVAGHQGVDLFFVLSGWLIGSLYWSEERRYGNVQIPRFMLRRLIRTVPPYLIIVCVALAGSHFLRHEAPAFDWGYLVFIQNYYDQIPFFQPSWSLCVEEHFYLVMPVLMLCFAGKHKRWHSMGLLAIVLIPLLCRNIPGIPGPHTATHRVFEGLLLGVWCSRTKYKLPNNWAALQHIARRLVWLAVVYLPLNEYLPVALQERISPTMLALCYACILVAIVERPPLPLATNQIIFRVALWSYSLYLTHSLSINAFNTIVARRVGSHVVWLLPVYIAFVFFGAAAFYYCVEAVSILIRDRIVPRREDAVEKV